MAPVAAPGRRGALARGVALLGLAVAVSLLAGCGGGDGAREDAARPRNVVLFVVDTLRADRLGCYGYPRETSPNLDRLAARGTVYARNYAQGCWTVPSMISLMSGLYVFDEEQQLPRSYMTLAESLSRAGLATAGFAGNSVLVHDRGFERGFDHFEGDGLSGRAAVVVDRFVRWYEASRDERADASGFFAWVHVTDPHHEYAPPEPHRLWDEDDPRPDEEELLPLWLAERERALDLATDDAPTVKNSLVRMRRASNDYDGEVRAMDAAFGRLLGFLEREGELDDTLVVFASDHGEMLFEQPHYPLELELRLEREGGLPDGLANLFAVGHRAWFYEELWNTPLVIAGPGFPEGVVREELTANVDVYPTILDALGLRIPTWLPGRSLVGGRAPEHERVFSYGYYTTAVIEEGGLKLVEHLPRRFRLAEDAENPVELFDLGAADGERANVAAERPDEAARLLDAVRAWRREVRRDFSTQVSDKDVEALRDMGYLGDG